MDKAVLVLQGLGTIVIALCALATLKATRLYASVSGLALLADAIRHGKGADRDPQTYSAVIRILREHFPRECRQLERYLPKEAREKLS